MLVRRTRRHYYRREGVPNPQLPHSSATFLSSSRSVRGGGGGGGEKNKTSLLPKRRCTILFATTSTGRGLAVSRNYSWEAREVSLDTNVAESLVRAVKGMSRGTVADNHRWLIHKASIWETIGLCLTLS